MKAEKTLKDLAILTLTCMVLFIATPSQTLGGIDTLRCKNDVVQTGDSELSLLKACGEPTMKKTETAPYHVGGKIAYKDIDRWYYNRGSNDFIYIITLEAGKITSIETGERGY